MAVLSLHEVVQKVDELPALPNITYKVIQMTGDPKTSINQLAETIGGDQVLTAKVLRLANSAYYGYARTINTIREAVVILGFDRLRNLVMAASVANVIDSELSGYFLPKGELWKHSMSTAVLARNLAQKTRTILPDQAFTAGLLHDIGKVVLDIYMQDLFKKVMNAVLNENIPFMDAEREILGFDHAEVGSRVAEKWNLPPELIEAIAFHHNPNRATNNIKLVCLVHAADAISMSMGIGLGADGMMYPFEEIAVLQLNLSQETIESAISDLAEILPAAEME